MQHQRPLVDKDRLRISADQISQRGSARVVVRRKVIDLEQRIALTADDPHRLGIALPYPAGHKTEQQTEYQGHRDEKRSDNPPEAPYPLSRRTVERQYVQSTGARCVQGNKRQQLLP